MKYLWFFGALWGLKKVPEIALHEHPTRSHLWLWFYFKTLKWVNDWQNSFFSRHELCFLVCMVYSLCCKYCFLLLWPRSKESFIIFILSWNNNRFIFHLHSKIAYYSRLLGDFFSSLQSVVNFTALFTFASNSISEMNSWMSVNYCLQSAVKTPET